MNAIEKLFIFSIVCNTVSLICFAIVIVSNC